MIPPRVAPETRSSPKEVSAPGGASTKLHRLRPLLLRWPAPPYLLAGDVLAFTLSCGISWSVSGIDVAGLTVLLLCLHLSGLYRSRVTMSLLDDTPRILVSVLAAMTAQVALDELVAGTAARGPLLLQSTALLALVLSSGAGSPTRPSTGRGAPAGCGTPRSSSAPETSGSASPTC